MTHTPGPWKIDPVPPLAVIADNEDGDGIATLEGDAGFPEIHANARLIAAAPDLLEALKEAIEELNQCCSDAHGEDYNNPKFNAVLAKVWGQS